MFLSLSFLVLLWFDSVYSPSLPFIYSPTPRLTSPARPFFLIMSGFSVLLHGPPSRKEWSYKTKSFRRLTRPYLVFLNVLVSVGLFPLFLSLILFSNIFYRLSPRKTLMTYRWTETVPQSDIFVDFDLS